jgi:hypothetical protein
MRKYYNWYHRNTKHGKRLLGSSSPEPRINGQIPRYIQLTKTKSGRNRKSEQTSKEIE